MLCAVVNHICTEVFLDSILNEAVIKTFPKCSKIGIESAFVQYLKKIDQPILLCRFFDSNIISLYVP